MSERINPVLEGHKALVVGIANGFSCAYLATPFARRLTGGTVYVDGGANIIA
jgi:enoyl-[acyl-carrier-protein] reductase (NADH)